MADSTRAGKKGLDIYETIELFLSVPGRKITFRSANNVIVFSLQGVDGLTLTSKRFASRHSMRKRIKPIIDAIIEND